MKLGRLEAARGFAAAYVVAHHTIPHSLSIHGVELGILLRFGQEAVILFFLLSGFVIHYSHQRHRDQSAARYFFDRSTRIYVPLLCSLLLSYAAMSVARGRPQDPQIVALVANLVMLQDIGNYPGALFEPYMGNTPLWSLSYECWFYVLYFIVASLPATWRTKSLIAFGIALFSAAAYLWQPLFALRIGFYFAIWWSGASLAQAYLQQAAVRPSDVLRAAWPLAIIAVLLALNAALLLYGGAPFRWGLHPLLELRHVVSACVILGVAVVWQALGWRGFAWTIAPFAVLAPVSYGLYIVHVPAFSLCQTCQVGSTGAFAAQLGLTLGLAFLLERLIYPQVKAWLQAALFRRPRNA